MIQQDKQQEDRRVLGFVGYVDGKAMEKETRGRVVEK